MRELVVETTDPTPPYEQLRRQLAALIRDGALTEGERLPPLRQLAGDLGVAVGTVARTYRELETAGLIVSRRGGGTRVAGAAPPGPGSRASTSSDRIVPSPTSPSSSPGGSMPGPGAGASSRSEALLRAAEAYVDEGRRLGVDRAALTEALDAVLNAYRSA